MIMPLNAKVQRKKTVTCFKDDTYLRMNMLTKVNLPQGPQKQIINTHELQINSST